MPLWLFLTLVLRGIAGIALLLQGVGYSRRADLPDATRLLDQGTHHVVESRVGAQSSVRTH